VIVLDANLLLHAYDETSQQNPAASSWLQETFSGTELIGLPWISVWAFLRIATNIRIMTNPITMEQGIAVVDSWLKRANVRLLHPGEGHWALLQRMLIEGQIRGPAVTDAIIAALTIEHGGVLHTADRGFARYPGLNWIYPLAES
jgi:toxin-antitoxin system PIN domain toxin